MVIELGSINRVVSAATIDFAGIRRLRQYNRVVSIDNSIRMITHILVGKFGLCSGFLALVINPGNVDVIAVIIDIALITDEYFVIFKFDTVFGNEISVLRAPLPDNSHTIRNLADILDMLAGNRFPADQLVERHNTSQTTIQIVRIVFCIDLTIFESAVVGMDCKTFFLIGFMTQIKNSRLTILNAKIRVRTCSRRTATQMPNGG